MKQITIAALVIIFLFSSCSKNADSVDQIDESALKTVMSSKDDSQMRIAYELLKPVEKQELWNRHIRYFIQSRELTSEQLSFVMEFKKQWIVRNLFENNSTVLINYTKALPQIKEKAQSILGVPDAFALLIDLPSDRQYYNNTAGIIQQRTNNVEETEELEGKNDCKCSRTDSYCNVGNCRDNGCTTSNLGCGTLWLFSCNGVCSLI